MNKHTLTTHSLPRSSHWLSLTAAVTLSFCSCQTLTPRTEEIRVDRVGNATQVDPAGSGRRGVPGAPHAEHRQTGHVPQSGYVEPSVRQNAPWPPRVGTTQQQVMASQPQFVAVPIIQQAPAAQPTAATAPRDVSLVSHDVPIASVCERCGPNCPGGGNHLPPALPSTLGVSYGPPVVARDEFVCNGGDRETQVNVRSDWSVVGLHTGDAVAHYDTIDGQTFIEPTNDVCLYAPRFASVRKVSGVILHEQHQRSAGVEFPTRIVQQAETQIPTTTVQPLQPIRNLSVNGPNSFREHTRGSGLENTQIVRGTEGSLLPYQDFLIIKRGVFDNTEKARLTARLQAAVAWSHDSMLQIVMDGKLAYEASNQIEIESVHVYELPEGKSRLRIVKIADKQNARPGDTVDFTIRFDNVGDQTIGNVTVIDSLDPRLEYIEDSQECSLKADFFTQPNEGHSLTLRWEVIDPMQVGDGGVVRFKCRVR